MLLTTYLIITSLVTHINTFDTKGRSDIGNVIKNENKMQIKVNGKIFDISLENNSTSKEFQKRLPLQLNMKDLNSNEKFIYLDKDLPSDPTDVYRINSGDIMLYGANCIVIFYKSFNTTYQYTKIGKIINPEGLENALGKGNTIVGFI